jgi:hypothetical protein
MKVKALDAANAFPEKQEGSVRRRLTDEHELDVFLVHDPVGRVLALEVRNLPDGLRLPAVEVGDVLDVDFISSDGVLRVRLLAQDFSDVFYVLVDDLVETVIGNPGRAMGGRAVLLRLHRWERLLEASSKGLSDAAQKGLFGELYVLSRLITEIGYERAIRGWKGPEGGVRDFDLVGTAVEVKTTSGKGLLTVRVSSSRQLETDMLDRLFLWCVSIEKNETGKTLNDLVEHVQDLASGDSELISRFQEKLSCVGYRSLDRLLYTTRFAVRGDQTYLVSDGFPRIVAGETPNGVFDVSYSLALEACASWRVEPRTIWDASHG